MSDDLYEKGKATRAEVLGNSHVAQAESQTTSFDAFFQRWTTESSWGAVWSRPQLTKRERSLITIALLASRGLWDELELHTKATANTGATPDDLQEVFLHVGIYGGGMAAANRAFKVTKQTLAKMEESKQA